MPTANEWRLDILCGVHNHSALYSYEGHSYLRRLSEEERKAALCLSRAVKAGQETICKGIKAEEVLTKMREIIETEPLAKIDYVSMVDALDMQPVEIVEKDVLVAMAVYIGKTRLIDNFSYEV